MTHVFRIQTERYYILNARMAKSDQPSDDVPDLGLMSRFIIATVLVNPIPHRRRQNLLLGNKMTEYVLVKNNITLVFDDFVSFYEYFQTSS